MAKNYTPPPEYVRRMANLERSDYDLVKLTARQRGLGSRGFSAAVRMIIREWSDIQPPPDLHPKYPPAPQPPGYRKPDG